MHFLFLLFLILVIDSSKTLVKASTRPRISDTKCQQYKELVARVSSLGGLCLAGDCQHKKIKTYRCANLPFSIVGKTKARSKEFPHMAAIGWKNPGGILFKCEGSLISDSFVLTTAVCGKDENDKLPSIVRLGDQNLVRTDDGARPIEIKIRRIFTHPKYNQRNKEHNIALIELKEKVIFRDHIRPACLYQQQYFTGSVVATGWGNSSRFSNASGDLMKVSLPTVDNLRCYNQLYANLPADEIFENQICAGGGRNSDTRGDNGGGPIQVSHSDARCVYDIVGLSHEVVDAYGTFSPTVHTRVYSYLDWIEPIVWKF